LFAGGCTRTPEQSAAEFVGRGNTFLDKQEVDRALLEFRNAVQAQPDNLQALFGLGEAYRAQGDVGLAMRYFRRVTDLDPKFTDAQLRVAELLSSTSEPALLAEAEKRAEGVLAVRPKDPAVLQVLAMCELKLQKVAEASRHLDSALSINPSHLPSVYSLVALHVANGKPELAEATLHAAEKKSSSAELQVAMAQFYRMKGQLPQAEAYVRRALSMKQNQPAALAELARLHAVAGRTREAAETLKLLAKADKRYRTQYADFLFENGQQEVAFTELQDWLKKHPDDREAITRLTDLYIRSGKLDKAQQTIQQALEKNARDPDAIEHRARIAIAAGKFTEAEHDMMEVLRARPSSGKAHLLQAQAHCGLGKQAICRQELEEALKLDPSLLQARILLSENLRKTGAGHAALQLMENTPQGQKLNLAAIIERGWILLALGRYDEAEKQVQSHLSISRTPALLLQSGLLLSRKQQFGSARIVLEEALKAESANLTTLDAIAYALAAEKRQSEAIERIRRHAAEHPQVPELQQLLGNWLERTGDPNGARSAYAAALSTRPQFSAAAVAAARLDLMNGRWNEARLLTRGVLATEPNNVDALLAQAMLEDATGDRTAAIKCYRLLLAQNRNHTAALNNLAARLSEDPSTLDEALKLATRVKELAPNSAAVDDTLGWIYYQKGFFPTAVNHLSAAAARDNSARTHYHLAMALIRAGNRAQGLKAYQRASSMDPNLPEAKAVKEIAGL
jgi:tetratricopeptide (TPR) repeat protein